MPRRTEEAIDEHRWDKLLVDEHRPKFRRKRAARNAGEKAGHRTDVRLVQGCRDGANVRRIHACVAVSHNQHLMAYEAHHREHVRDLRVRRAGNFTNVDLDIPIGKRRRHALCNFQSAIVSARDAEDELTNRIVLQRERTQVLLETGLLTVQGHEQTDRRQVGGGVRLRFAPSEARNAYNRDRRITDRRDRGDIQGRRQDTRKLHATRFANPIRRPFFGMRRKFECRLGRNDFDAETTWRCASAGGCFLLGWLTVLAVRKPNAASR